MRHEFDNLQNWHGRDFLPHYDSSDKYQMITYRLADSLPKGALNPGTTGVSPVRSDNDKLEKRKVIEEALDKNYGSCILREPRIAKIIIAAWDFFDKERYDLIAYVVMPNHIHLLIKTYEKYTLASIVHSWKSFTAHEIKKLLRNDLSEGKAIKIPVSEKIWQIEYWDRFIRDDQHFKNAINYIHNNPVKAGLCKTVSDWEWSSIHFFEKD